jgi:photosystem II stability/assembly factor-like uncharacterized protein
VYSVVGSAVCKYVRESRYWEFAGDGLISRSISSLSFDTDSPSTLYAGTSNGIYRTTDGGRLWEPFGKTMLFNQIQFFETHPSIRTRMYVSMERGLEVSTDKGSTWTGAKPYGASYQLRSFTFSPVDAGRVYGATKNKGVVTSEDGGITWKEIGYWPNDQGISAVTIDPQDQKILYVWTMKGDGFRSTDNGTLWHPYVPPWKPGDTVCISPDRYAPSSAVALVNGHQLFFTQGGGATWLEIPITPLPDEMCSLCWNRTTSMLYAGTGGSGVYQVSLRKSLEKIVRK